MRRWVPLLLVLIALALVPWAIWLMTVLPSHEVAEHWDLAWGGFDLLLAASLLATAAAAWRRSPLLEAAAASTGTLLIVDVWFDLLTSEGRNLTYAIALAVLAELPLAALCLWIVLDSETCTHRLTRWRSASSNGARATAATSLGDGQAHAPGETPARRLTR